MGYHAGRLITTGIENTVVGGRALDATTTGSSNVAIGQAAMSSNTTASNNVAVGKSAMASQTTGGANTVIGDSALGSDTTGLYAVAVGKDALLTQNFTDSTQNYNVAVGTLAGKLITTGNQNTLMGGGAGDALTDADDNVAIGFAALSSDTLGSRSVAIGKDALFDQNYTTATNGYNVAVGYSAGANVTTGIRNNFLGGLAGFSTTTGSKNVAIGLSALEGNTVGSRSIAIGNNALGVQNPSTATDMYNVAVGDHAGNDITTGIENTMLGGTAGDALTSGSYNTLVGREAGTYNTDLQTGSANVLIGAFTDTTATNSLYAVGLGYGIDAEAGFTTVGQGANDIRAAHGTATWNTVSDERYKKDIEDSTAGLSFINALRPRTFKYKTLGELPETFRAYVSEDDKGDPERLMGKKSTDVYKNSKTNHGFIAQEVKSAIEADDSLKDGFMMWNERDDGSQEVAEAALIPVLVKAIQELSAEIEKLKSGG